ncbi:MAG: phage holin family protein [Gammaproteobacteria bacterium]|nr:phage holin family protein [Gammaproteobacteria bacterium]
MNANAKDEAIEQQASPRTCPPPSESSILEDTQTLWHELHGLAYDRLRLATLETQRAGQSLVTMIISGVMIALFLSSAWMGLMVVVVVELIEKDVTLSSAILLAVVVNLLIALILFSVIRLKARDLGFPATLRSLKTDATQQAAGEDVNS